MASAASHFLRRVGLRAPKSNRLGSTLARQSLASLSNVVINGAPPVSSRRGVATVSAGDALARLASEHPHVDVIRYEHKNVKWTLRHVNFFADALACGLIETGLQPGDVVLSWLPLHFAEQHILQFACSKAGFVLYHLDPNPELAISDPEKSKAALAKALEMTEANVFVTQEAGDDVNYIHLTEGVIPEIRIFDFGEGMPFFTPRYPHLRFPIHTGFDITDKEGMFPLKHMLVGSNNLDTMLRDSGCPPLNGKTPLMGELVIGNDGLPEKKGKVLSNEEVFHSKTWPEFSSVLSKEYKEVSGVGVVF